MKRTPWERRGAAIYTECDGRKGKSELIVDLYRLEDAAQIAQRIIDCHNRDAGYDPKDHHRGSRAVPAQAE